MKTYFNCECKKKYSVLSLKHKLNIFSQLDKGVSISEITNNSEVGNNMVK